MWSHPFFSLGNKLGKKILVVAPLLHSQWQGNTSLGQNGAFLQQSNFGVCWWEDYILVTWNPPLTELEVFVISNTWHFSSGPQVLYEENSNTVCIWKSETEGAAVMWSRSSQRAVAEIGLVCIPQVSCSDSCLSTSHEGSQRTWIIWIDLLSIKSCVQIPVTQN